MPNFFRGAMVLIYTYLKPNCKENHKIPWTSVMLPRGHLAHYHSKSISFSTTLRLHQLLCHYEILTFSSCASCWNTMRTLWMCWKTCPFSLRLTGVPTDSCHSSIVASSHVEKVKTIGVNSRGLGKVTFEVATCQVCGTSINPCRKLFHLPLDPS